MKICCIVSHLAGGGAARVLSLLANQWAARGESVTMVTLTSTEADVYELDGRVNRVALDVETESRSSLWAIAHNARKIGALRRAVASTAPDVVISFVDRVNVLTLLACVGLRVPVLVSERIHPSYHDVGTIWTVLRRLTYPLADALVVQSEAVRSWAERLVSPRRTRVIPNPVGDRFHAPVGATSASRRPVVLGVGRLVAQKGFDLLIRAFHLAFQAHSEWSLAIVGEGPQEAELKKLAAQLLPPASVLFAGPAKDLRRYYQDAALFALPSRYEGFPNALLEAMACGCAVISTACPGGTAEIIRHDVDGVLVPPNDVTALAAEMERLMRDEGERKRLGDRAAESSLRFRPDGILALWDNVFSDVGAVREVV